MHTTPNITPYTVIDRLGDGTDMARRVRWCLLKRTFYAQRCMFRTCRKVS
ncbi:hypothetical protein [Pararhodobacter sp. CCB-MM2]|nr:hypothetical protein [Pararhodobacter sp. CCB-MM2]